MKAWRSLSLERSCDSSCIQFPRRTGADPHVFVGKTAGPAPGMCRVQGHEVGRAPAVGNGDSGVLFLPRQTVVSTVCRGEVHGHDASSALPTCPEDPECSRTTLVQISSSRTRRQVSAVRTLIGAASGQQRLRACADSHLGQNPGHDWPCQCTSCSCCSTNTLHLHLHHLLGIAARDCI